MIHLFRCVLFVALDSLFKSHHVTLVPFSHKSFVQNVSEMTDLRDADEDEYHKQIAAMSITFKAFRYCAASPKK